MTVQDGGGGEDNLNGEPLRVATEDNQGSFRFHTYIWFNLDGEIGTDLYLFMPFGGAGCVALKELSTSC